MENFQADEKVLKKVIEIIIDSLALEEELEEISPDASIIDDLGGDSLDLLELVFKLEEGFEITIKRGEIEKTAQGGIPDEEFADKGILTDKGLSRLKEVMPEISDDKFTTPFSMNRIPNLFSPKTFTRIVMEQLAKKAAADTSNS